MTRLGWVCCLSLAIGCGTATGERATMAPGAAAAPTKPEKPASGSPATPVRTVVDHYHGVAVSDPYRWLEDAGSSRVRAWTAAQNAHTRALLDDLPGRDALATRVREVLTAPATGYHALQAAGGGWFVLVEEPPRQQAFLVTLPAFGDRADARVVLDPGQLDPSGKTTIDWFRPAPDGQRVAVSLSRAGTENGDVHVVNVATGAVEEQVSRVHGGTAGGDLAWTADGSGFYYTRYPHPGERPTEDLAFYQQLYFHRLGTPAAEDRYELGKGFPRIAEIRVQIDHPTGRVLLAMQKGDGGEFEHHMRGPNGHWRKLAGYADKLVELRFGPGGDLFGISRLRSPRGEVLRLPGPTHGLQQAPSIYQAEDATLVSDFWDGGASLFASDRWYGVFQLGGPTEVRAFDYSGKRLPLAQPLPVASAGRLRSDGQGGVLMRAESFVQPPAFYRVASDGTVAKTALQTQAPVDMTPFTVLREQATSRDGTRVPVSILLPAGHPGVDDGGGAPGPCVVNGYGGYGISLEPRFSLRTGMWLERGVCFAIANLRGGGEFGEAWHRSGMLTHKQNVFDDFAAVLQHLVARGYTTPDQLGILGGSNGGLLMGATVVQHPAQVRAAVSFVGLYDMLRVELSPNGAFNVTEFGTVQDPAQFEALMAYSPYHHVREQVAYPAMMFLTGENDPRVDPMHSRKMTARLQAASSGDGPILLRSTADTGHGSGTSLDEQVRETTDVYAFMLHALGVPIVEQGGLRTGGSARLEGLAGEGHR